MRALVLRQHGALEDLRVVDDHPMPQASAEHVVIRVRASSFNHHDVFTVKGMPGIKVPLPVVLGLDMAGEVFEIHEKEEKWKPGDRVLVNPLNKQHGLMGAKKNGVRLDFSARFRSALTWALPQQNKIESDPIFRETLALL